MKPPRGSRNLCSPPDRPGHLLAIEGLSGTGKTFLTTHAIARLGPRAPHVLDDFSQRLGRSDLGSRIITELAASGDRFLRGGLPASETLLLLAVQMHAYEVAQPHLHRGHDVLEGRSVHAVAVYQAVLRHPDDPNQALGHARMLIELAAAWRPLPDRVLLITDDVPAALARVEARDGRTHTREELRLHHLADQLYTSFAAEDQARFHILDRRTTQPARALDEVTRWCG
ncbi:thymidylate kinase [Spongiactinospora gelatinilytica]|uniref:thymidylate kinase n=1 Tax=Spongiactinospora gelatinilytica TaxID=2666298 RepID=UPI00131451ED|nr:thymidylate kinase [Spongiactinospora gelatinilytica]